MSDQIEVRGHDRQIETFQTFPPSIHFHRPTLLTRRPAIGKSRSASELRISGTQSFKTVVISFFSNQVFNLTGFFSPVIVKKQRAMERGESGEVEGVGGRGRGGDRRSDER